MSVCGLSSKGFAIKPAKGTGSLWTLFYLLTLRTLEGFRAVSKRRKSNRKKWVVFHSIQPTFFYSISRLLSNTLKPSNVRKVSYLS